MSVSQLNSFGRCDRRWFFQKVRRVKSPKLKKAANTGTEIHGLHDDYYKKGFVPKGHPHERKVLASLERLPKCGPDVDSEVPFRIEEPNQSLTVAGVEVPMPPFTGVIDLVDRRLMPTLRIIDHKTTSAIAIKESDPVDLLADPQMLTYAEVGYRLYDAQRVEVAHNTISTTHVARVLPPVFTYVPRELAAENWAKQRTAIRTMLAIAASPPADWNDVPGPRARDACFDFGGCDYLPICALKTPTIGVDPMSHDPNAASDLLARLNALSATGPATPPVAPILVTHSPVIEVIDETPTTPIELVETSEIALLPPDAPPRMTPVVVEEAKPEPKKRGRKAKAAETASAAVAAVSVEYFTEKSIGNVEEAVAYMNERAEEGVRCVGIYDGLYFVFERPKT